MVVYRIAKKRYVNDLSGIGARITGGRWNHKGVAIVYTSESRSLATVETLVHVDLATLPEDLYVASIQVPQGITPKEISISELPPDWRAFPYSSELANIGSEWVLKNQKLLLRVPSAVVEYEYNILINPSHPDIRQVKVIQVEKFTYDKRLMR